ncbi:MAG: hypothetical protein KH135_00620 [Firmicutes bacterium]|nr:hypothetical protein [Bacillota bacterium]
MYKFTNGIVVFDEKTRDNYLKAGYKLEIKSKKIESQHIPPGIVKFDEEIEGADINVGSTKNENSSNDGTIEEKPRRSKKVSK